LVIEIGSPDQRVQDFFGKSIGEPFQILGLAEILKRQYSNRLFRPDNDDRHRRASNIGDEPTFDKQESDNEGQCTDD